MTDEEFSASPRAEAALGIIHAQYGRELTRAVKAEPGERAAALLEARRLAQVGAALVGRLRAGEVADVADLGDRPDSATGRGREPREP